MTNHYSIDLRTIHIHSDMGHKLVEEEKFDFLSYKNMMDIVCLAIENTLRDFGPPYEYEKILERLDVTFHCGLQACVGHPDYLKSVLDSLYGNSSKAILSTITKRIAEYDNDEDISGFITVLNQ